MPKLEIAIIGTGYVGLVSALCFCKLGHNITAFDTDINKISALSRGKSTLFEKDLDNLLSEALENQSISFTSDLSQLANKDVIFIAVGTPFDYATSETDLSQINSALSDIVKYASNNCLIINKSTAPIGTYQKLKDYIKSHNRQLLLAVNPEFLAQGEAIENFLSPDRIVVGFEAEEARVILTNIYQPLIDQNVNYIETDPASAEIAKYAANNFLALKIAFINEIANLSENVSANYEDIKKIVTSDARIDSHFMNAGPGFGGSCFPKDSASFARSFEHNNVSGDIIRSINISNDATINHLVTRIQSILVGKGQNIAILGLTFKAGTDDVRSSQSTIIINKLLALGYNIKAYDPEAQKDQVMNLVKGDITITEKAEDVFHNSNLCIILTEWPEFKNYDYRALSQLMQSRIIYDTRNILDPKKLLDSEIILYKRGQ
ncbi:MAG: UDP-glucose/GDP-mannose dehydrogenase family protein [Rickettsiales bacterium]|jgi:UDPglucose 6-dehydrogenase|nr:UDP-glucose/GDP-mannose dehydrogenase family protein [Rickettsiales bacterium]